MDGYKIFFIHILGASEKMRQLCLLLVHAINANPQVFLGVLVTLFPMFRQLHALYSLCFAMIVEKSCVQLCTNHLMKNVSEFFAIQYSGPIPVSLIVFLFSKKQIQKSKCCMLRSASNVAFSRRALNSVQGAHVENRLLFGIRTRGNSKFQIWQNHE